MKDLLFMFVFSLAVCSCEHNGGVKKFSLLFVMDMIVMPLLRLFNCRSLAYGLPRVVAATAMPKEAPSLPVNRKWTSGL